MSEFLCPECGLPMYTNPSEGAWMTLVGYFSPEGHDHDDNCLHKAARCANGHVAQVSIRRVCPAPGCNWKGKEVCFCNPHKKLDSWPVKE